jgi:hypothetical protein
MIWRCKSGFKPAGGAGGAGEATECGGILLLDGGATPFRKFGIEAFCPWGGKGNALLEATGVDEC